MNNAFFDDAAVEVPDRLPQLRAREGELITLIEAIRRIEASEDWSTLTINVFDQVVEKLERSITSEAGKSEVSLPELYRLQGQLAWAKKYADLGKLADSYRLELTNVRNQIKLHG